MNKCGVQATRWKENKLTAHKVEVQHALNSKLIAIVKILIKLSKRKLALSPSFARVCTQIAFGNPLLSNMMDLYSHPLVSRREGFYRLLQSSRSMPEIFWQLPKIVKLLTAAFKTHRSISYCSIRSNYQILQSPARHRYGSLLLSQSKTVRQYTFHLTDPKETVRSDLTNKFSNVSFSP